VNAPAATVTPAPAAPRHSPCQCPGPYAPGRLAAAVIASHPEQGWSLLCNGIIYFEDTGAILPGGIALAPHRSGPAPDWHADPLSTHARSSPAR
jgi:Family of unknown function (DUF5999)